MTPHRPCARGEFIEGRRDSSPYIGEFLAQSRGKHEMAQEVCWLDAPSADYVELSHEVAGVVDGMSC